FEEVGAATSPRAREQRELGDKKAAAAGLKERVLEPPVLVLEDAEVENLVGEVLDVVEAVPGRDAEQGDEAPVDAADHLAIRLDRRSGHALQQGPHVVRSR